MAVLVVKIENPLIDFQLRDAVHSSPPLVSARRVNTGNRYEIPRARPPRFRTCANRCGSCWY
jgi:hypothetical protein